MNFGLYSFPKKKFANNDAIEVTATNGLLQILAAGSIQIGDLVASTSSGIRALPLTAMNKFFGGAIPSYEAAGILQGNITAIMAGGAASVGTRTVPLLNGGFMALHWDNTGSATANFYSANGGLINSVGMGTASASYRHSTVLTNGNVVVAYISTGNNALFSIFKPDGLAVVTGQVVESTGCTNIRVVALPDGTFVITWLKTDVKFARYNAAGTIQGSITSAIVAAYSGTPQQVVATVSGGFAIVGKSAVNTGKLMTYTSAGTAANNVTFANVHSTQQDINLQALADGGMLVSFSNTSAKASFARYDSNCALQGSVVTIDASITLTAPPLCAQMAEGGLVFAFTDGALIYTAVYSSSDNSVVTATKNVLLGTATSITLTPLLLSGYAITGRTLAIFSSDATIVSQITAIDSDAIYNSSACLATGEFVATYVGPTATNYYFRRFSGQRQVILGVADTSANIGNVAVVRFGDTANRPRSVMLSSDVGTNPLTFDSRALLGCAGELISKTGLMKGMST